MITDPDLWRRIKAHDFDDLGADFTFTDRLAAEQGWTLGFARRVIEEYRRYIYLAAIGQREVNPSRAVEEVWRLHLTYTRDYWGSFCANVLGRPLHHEPSSRTGAENQRYSDAYAATLAIYQNEFGIEPDDEIWPSEDERIAKTLTARGGARQRKPRNFIAALQRANTTAKWTIVGLVTLATLLAAFLALTDPRAYVVALLFAGFGGFLTLGTLFGYDRKKQKRRRRSDDSRHHVDSHSGSFGDGGGGG